MTHGEQNARSGRLAETVFFRRFAPALAAALLAVSGPAGCSGDDDDDTATPVPGDLDGDGYSPETGDCLEGDARTHPGATETCNGKDDDCDSSIDPGCDQDGDGYLGTASGGDDCDDASIGTYPGAPERCDGADNNCDDVIDNVQDVDADGYLACETAGLPVDCNDGDATIYPGALEILDGTIDDCDAAGQRETIEASGAAASIIGEYADDQEGIALASAGDLNGDGIDDLVVGAPGADAGTDDTGKVYVLFGGGDGALSGVRAQFPSTLDISYADLTFGGVASGDQAGRYVAGVGDVNGDDLDDLWIGAPGADNGAGAGYLILGRETWTSTFVPLTDADAVFEGPDPDSALGPASGGDVDADGNADLLIGAPGSSSEEGAAWLFYGGSTLPAAGDAWSSSALSITGGTAGARTGAAVSLESDVNGDGRRDLTLSAPGVGQVWVLVSEPGDWAPSLADAQVTMVGPVGEEVGIALSFAGDLNEDGYQDLVIGAPGTSGAAGRVFVVLFKPSLLQAHITLEDESDLIFDGASGAGLGASVASGDLNGDGIDDLAVGAPGTSTAWLLYGWDEVVPSSGLMDTAADAGFAGPPSAGAGAAVMLSADLNGDGAAEWSIGAPAEPSGGTGAGATYLLFGYGP